MTPAGKPRKSLARRTKAELLQLLTDSSSHEEELEKELEQTPTACEVGELRRDLEELTRRCNELERVAIELVPLALKGDRSAAENILMAAECVPWRYRPPFI